MPFRNRVLRMYSPMAFLQVGILRNLPSIPFAVLGTISHCCGAFLEFFRTLEKQENGIYLS